MLWNMWFKANKVRIIVPFVLLSFLSFAFWIEIYVVLFISRFYYIRKQWTWQYGQWTPIWAFICHLCQYSVYEICATKPEIILQFYIVLCLLLELKLAKNYEIEINFLYHKCQIHFHFHLKIDFFRFIVDHQKLSGIINV